MIRQMKRGILGGTLPLFLLMVFFAFGADAMVDGITGPTFNLRAKSGYILTPEGGSIFTWGYSDDTGPMQYPGPTLIVNQGDNVTVNLTNELSVPVSILFPGQENVIATGGILGAVTREAQPSGGSVTYTFVADRPGTYHYHSGTNTQLQIEMGLVGALIVRPAAAGQAYNHADSAFDREYLFLLTEMDPIIHELVETGRLDLVDFSTYFPVYWFINGRCAPDTMAMPYIEWLPNQPYNCMPRMHPGERMLMRFVNAGRDLHPFHTHGNHMQIIALDGRLLESAPGSGADISYYDFTFTGSPGGTADAIFRWTGEKLGWDIYGHAPGDALEPNEYAPDHGKPFPVVLPEIKQLTYGAFYSGSPFLGVFGYIPPGDCNANLNAGYFYMWHSHKEKEMTNNDVFPGGMMTMIVVEHPNVIIDEMAMGTMGITSQCFQTE